MSGDPACRNNGGPRPCDPGGVLRRSFDIATEYGIGFVEIYKQEVFSLPAAIRHTHELLTK
jgi:hypothetical protein